MTDNKIGAYDLVAEPFHVDFTGRLTLGVLGNHLLNCAGFHATERGFGMAHINEENCTWVLSRLVIEMEDMPREYDKFRVETWVENVYRLFTDRDFAILAADGRVLGYARSVWAMIGMNTRRPVDLTSMHGGGINDYICDRPCPIDKPGRIKVAATEPATVIQAKYSDIDVNGHVNSIRYIEHILDLFPLETFRDRRIARFEMAYVAESYYGDELSIFLEKCGEAEDYNAEIRKNGGETVCRARVVFRENPE